MPRFSIAHLDRRALVAAAAFVVLVPAGSASAATRYAANYRFTNGAGVAPCTDPAKPCVLTTALASAVNGDEVLLSPGTYRAPGININTLQQPPWTDELAVPEGVTLRGPDPKKLPVIVVAPDAQAEAGVLVGKRGKITDVAINGRAKENASITYSLQLSESAVADRVRVQTTASDNVVQIGVSIGTGVTVRNVVSVGLGSATAGRITAMSAATKNFTATIRNSTAISLTPEGEGIATGTSDGTSTLTISNTIARGTKSDIRVRAGLSGGNATANVDHSNWIKQDVSAAAGGTATLSQTGGGNQNGPTAAEPTFVDAASGDYRQAEGSPTIDAGVVDVNNGPQDLGGGARHFSLTTDIGADEFDPADFPPPAPQPTTPEPTTPAAPQPTTGGTAPPAGPPNAPQTEPVDRVAPVISALTLGAKVKRSKGTSIRFTLSEPAKVALAFGQPSTGRTVGSKCVKQTSKNRKKSKCTLANVRGTLTVDGKAGVNTLTFKGKLSAKKTLTLGRYLLSATATDAAGNRSAAATRRFQLTR